MNGISIREFAKRDGCSDKLVREALKAGHLSALADGKLDPALVGSGWRKANRRSAGAADPGAEEVRRVRTPRPASAPAEEHAEDDATEVASLSDDEVDAAVQRLAGGFMDLAEAERRKAVALARIRELDFDLKSGAVVPADAVVERIGAEYARVRSRLLAIPAKEAPRLHRLRTPVEVQDRLLEAITEALQELAADGGGSSTS